MLPVANPGPWPTLQRYDFVVRTRPAVEGEIAAAKAERETPQRRAILRTLQAITGKDFGDRAADWRNGLTAMAAAHPSATEASPPMAARRGGSPRLIDHRCHFTLGRIGRPSGPTAIIRCPQGSAPCARRRSNREPNATATSDRSMTAGKGGTGKEGTPAI